MRKIFMHTILRFLGIDPSLIKSADKLYLTAEKGSDLQTLSAQMSELAKKSGIIIAVRHDSGSLRFAPEKLKEASGQLDTQNGHESRKRLDYGPQSLTYQNPADVD